MTPSSFKYLGPGTAVRDTIQATMDEERFSDYDNVLKKSNNLNDVCFGCDGGCSDVTCSSKRSSRVSADVESNICDTPVTCRSPTQGICGDRNSDLEPKLYEVDSLERGQGRCQSHVGDKSRQDSCHVPQTDKDVDCDNMNISQFERTNEGDSDNGNSQSNSPTKQTPSPKSPRSLKGSQKSPRTRAKKFKRLRSTGEAPDESPNKRGNMKKSNESLSENGQIHCRVRAPNLGTTTVICS